MNRLRGPLLSVALAAGAQFAFAHAVSAGPHDALISKHAAANGVPEALIRRVIHIESRGNPRAVSKGNYGLMQIRLGTARALGYSGTAQGLLDADTNMTYAVRYLANAYRAAGCSISRAIAYYQRGFYKKPQMRCGTTTAMSSRDQAPDAAELRGSLAHSDDVLKPRVVHIEKITRSPHATTSHHAVATRQPAAKFDPVRLAPPPVQEAAVALDSMQAPASSAKSGPTPAMSMQPMPRSRPALLAKSSPMTDGTQSIPAPESASADRVAILDPQAVPLPPARPEIAAKTEPAAKHTRHTTRRHVRTGRRKAAETSGVVSFLEKLSAPQKKSRRPQPQPITPYAPPVY
jgi:hypothetical protein